MNSASPTVLARLETVLDRISRLNPTYRAYSRLAPVDLDFVAKLDAERRSGRVRSPMHGLLVSVKGNIPIAGLPWTEGSAIFASRVAECDAEIVQRTREAGGIILGTTTLSELAMYAVENAFEPMGLNPWDVGRTAGGSSTGAGVAAALCLADVNLGTDSGGSIRNPACHCGSVGFMPSIGALSTEKIPNHTPSLSNVGLIARSVALVRATYETLGGAAESVLIKRRLIIPARLINEMCDAPSLLLFNEALRRLKSAGVELIERDIDGWLEGERAAGVVSLFESAKALSRMDLSNASAAMKQRALLGQAVAEDDVLGAHRAMRRLKLALEQALETADADAVATPTWPFAAPLIHADTVKIRDRQVPLDPHRNCFVRAANAAGACAITLPSGFYGDEGVPAGIQLMSAAGQEARLLAAAASIEGVLPQLPKLSVKGLGC